MKFNLRTVLLGISATCMLLAILVFALGRDAVDTASTGNICAFDDAVSAQEAANLNLQFNFKGLHVETQGVFAGKGTCKSNETNFLVRITGDVIRTVPELKKRWPFTLDELAERIESEIENNLTRKGDCKFNRLTISLHN